MFEVFKIYIIRNIMDMSRVYVDVNKLNDILIIFDIFIKLNIEYMFGRLIAYLLNIIFFC